MNMNMAHSKNIDIDNYMDIGICMDIEIEMDEDMDNERLPNVYLKVLVS
jgi:hypothetical protein